MDVSVWPLAGLAVQTPRLRLRYVTDELAAELAVLAGRGIHDPAVMPFSTPWTDVRSPELEHNAVRHFWRQRADTCVTHWCLSWPPMSMAQWLGCVRLRRNTFNSTAAPRPARGWA